MYKAFLISFLTKMSYLKSFMHYIHTAFIDRNIAIHQSILNLQYQHAYLTIMYCDTLMHHSIVPSLVYIYIQKLCTIFQIQLYAQLITDHTHQFSGTEEQYLCPHRHWDVLTTCHINIPLCLLSTLDLSSDLL